MTSTLPQMYARVAGLALVALGVGMAAAIQMGFIGFLSLTFHAFDNTLNVVHVLLGAVGLYAGFAAKPALAPALYAKAFGALYLVLGVAGFAAAGAFAPLGIGLELAENGLHVGLGALGLAAGFARPRADVPEAPAPRPADVPAGTFEVEAPAAYPLPNVRHQPIEVVEGIAETYGQKLRAIGIVEQEDLLPRDPAAVARDTGIPVALVEKWHAQVQLDAVTGIGPQYAELLVRAGVDGLAALARQTPAALAKKLADYEGSLEVRVQGGTVTKEMCDDWIKQARAFVKKGIPASPGASGEAAATA